MKGIMLAIATVAFATLAPFALAAEGQSDDPDKPTMAKLEGKINGISSQIVRLEATVGTLATKLDTLSGTVITNHTTIVGKFEKQMAVVMTVPSTTGESAGHFGRFYLVGDSSIAGFPAGTVAANGLLAGGNQALPAGTYLFELQHPYSDNVLCNRNVAKRHLVGGARFNDACPRLRLHLLPGDAIDRFDDGPVVYEFQTGGQFQVLHKFPTGFAFTDDKPVTSYGGAVRITKLK